MVDLLLRDERITQVETNLRAIVTQLEGRGSRVSGDLEALLARRDGELRCALLLAQANGADAAQSTGEQLAILERTFAGAVTLLSELTPPPSPRRQRRGMPPDEPVEQWSTPSSLRRSASFSETPRRIARHSFDAGQVPSSPTTSFPPYSGPGSSTPTVAWGADGAAGKAEAEAVMAEAVANARIEAAATARAEAKATLAKAVAEAEAVARAEAREELAGL